MVGKFLDVFVFVLWRDSYEVFFCDSVESTALRLITGLGNNEVQPQLSRFLSEPKTLVSAESEELNRALILTLARSMHITGTGNDSQSGMWCKELLNTIMQNTPHSWAAHTLQCFPAFLSEYFQQNPAQKENRQQLKVCNFDLNSWWNDFKVL